ncbi:MAG: chromosomal replication initiator protein DnaA, partial [Dokdonella sp.]|nr:chromosomal replication initiator protein DnaA [Dokdonella sp.]
MSELWQRCLARLEAQLSADDIHTYLAPLQAAQDAEALTLWAPNPYTLDTVRERFLAPVQEILAQ